MTTGTRSRATGGRGRATLTFVGASLTGAVLVAACGDSSSSGTSTVATSTGPVATAPPETSETPSSQSTEDTTLVTAPDSERVDLAEPTFTNPTAVTNPRFPIAELEQVIQLGEEAGAALRIEVTLLPETKVIEWNGQQVETLVSQFVAYEDGQVLEVAVDFFAQADAGAVWYFGEDVANYVDGVVDNTEGTWLAGKDGPPGMIMPANPQVGDVYRPENILGFVFEEVTVKSVDETVDGPTGPVEGAIIVQERSMDGVLEDKTFAPGYGEFFFAVEAEQEVVDMALAVPTDVVAGDVPAELTTISSGVEEISAATAAEDAGAIAVALDSIAMAREAYLTGDVPPLLAEQMTVAMDALTSAVAAGDDRETSEAAIEVGHANLDLQLQFRPPVDVDADRLELWARQLEVDQTVGDAAQVAGDEVVIDTIRRRAGQA